MSNQLPRQVKLFGAVSLLNDFASEMVYPLLPAFVTGVLGGGAAALGALDGAADAAAAFVKLIAGRLADRPSRRGPLIVGGYFLAAAVRPIIAVTAAAWQVIALRVVDRLGKGLRTPPRDALIGDVTPPPLVGRAFGLQRGLDHVGAVIGPLIAWWMLSTGADVRRVIVASLVPGVLVLVLARWAVRGSTRREGAGGAQEPSETVPPPPAPYRPLPPSVIAISVFSAMSCWRQACGRRRVRWRLGLRFYRSAWSPGSRKVRSVRSSPPRRGVIGGAGLASTTR